MSNPAQWVEATGRTVVVAVAAPLWASVEAAHEFPAFDSSSYPAYRDWMRQVVAQRSSLKGRLDSVALCGEPVRVLGTAGSLVRVELPAQPNGPAGYIGFMSIEHIGPDQRRHATHVVSQRQVLGRAGEPDAIPIELPAGAAVEFLASTGRDQAQVRLSSGVTVHCPRRALHPLASPLPAAELFAIASGYLGVPYVWGGTEASGIDCSGLVHTAARIGGHVISRDAHYQWADTSIAADWGDLDVGDLIFFGESASLEGIDHVGLYAGGGHMLHAPEEGRTVTLEPISDRARKRAVGFGRYPARQRPVAESLRHKS